MRRSLLRKIFPTPKYLRMPAMGVDVSDRAVKYAMLTDAENPRLDLYGEERIAPGVVADGVIKDAKVLGETLARIREKTKMNIAHVALPEEKAYLLDVDMPAPTSGGSMRETIELHLEEHVPLDPVSAVFDFEVLSLPTSEVQSEEIALTVIEGSMADSYRAVFESAGILPLSFELESHALARALVPSGTSKTYMVVDVGREQSNVSVVAGGFVRLAASIGVGGNALSKAIVADLGVSEDEARTMKETQGLFGGRTEHNAFESIVRVATLLRDEIYQRYNYWNSRFKGMPIEQILMCGGNASVPGLPTYLSSGLDVPVAIGNPWVNIASFDDYIPAIPANYALRYGTAIGLTLRSFVPNLL